MIVAIDFDGTLALGDTSDLEKMNPNMSLIYLINKMYDDGNIINIVTARGSKSCNSIAEREKKYLLRIKSWLELNNVKYHGISFNKEYADVYIDDRCYNIKETFFYNRLDSFFTTNKVRRFNDSVIKKSESSLDEFEWYKRADKLSIKTPGVLFYDNDTISTNFVDGEICKNFDLIKSVLKTFQNEVCDNGLNFNSYIQRIENHLLKNEKIIGGNILLDKLKTIQVPQTFNHGDFSVFNMLELNNELYLIDPIFNKNLFQSYYLDIAKHLFSILYYLFDYELYMFFKKQYINDFDLNPSALDILIASESVRVSNRNNKFYSITNNLIDSLI